MTRRRVVLVGAGHASLQVLASWGHADRERAELCVVSDRAHAYYSGMVPGWVAGEYELDDLSIPLAPLADRAGAELVLAPAVAVDARDRRIEVAGRAPVDYDVALIDVGSTVAGLDPTVRTHAIPARPIGGLIDRLREDGLSGSSVVVGAGAGGIELALALRARGSAVQLVEAAPDLLPAGPRRLGARLTEHCRRRGVELRLGRAVAGLEAGELVLASGESLPFDRLVWATGAAPPELLAHSDVPRDRRGFVSVRATLQVEGCDDLFAAGDAASIAGRDDLPKAGVYAVRAGPIARHNLRAHLDGTPLRDFAPQRDFLALLNLGDGTAIGTKWGLVAEGRFVRRVKDRIDRRWIRSLREPVKKSVPDASSRGTP